MKNEIFNGQRFWTYFKYDFTQMWRNHMKAAIGIGLSGLILYIVTVAFNLIFGNGWSGPTPGFRYLIFILAFTALELYQTRTYGYLTDKRKGSAWLMNPASTFEKWLSMILMTIVILPLLFLGVHFLTDLLVTFLDPTTGDSLLKSFGNGFRAITDELLDANLEYETTWNIWAFIPCFIAGFFTNYLFFLLCGLVFKKNKILSGFVVIFLLTTLFSVLVSLLDPASISIEADNFAQAETYIRRFVTIFTWVGFLVAAGIAGGVYWRLKTLKH